MKNKSSKSISSSKVFGKEMDNSKMILRILALISIGLMLFGLTDSLLQTGSFSFPGPATMSIDQITHALSSNKDLVMMSSGIILFALIPSLRILLGINQFIHKHEIINLIVALIVLMELTVSFLLIFGVKGVLL